MRLRHIGIRVSEITEELVEFYERAGFKRCCTGTDIIGAHKVEWLKMIDINSCMIELVKNCPSHLSFTVNKLDPEEYIFKAPSGHEIQWVYDPDGNHIELVKEEDK